MVFTSAPREPELSVTISRRAALSVAVMIILTALRAYLDGSRSVTFSVHDEEVNP